MPVKIRLARHGARKRAYYRVVAADIRSPRDGRFLEILGTYNPVATPALIDLKGERIQFWLDQGAVPTKTVAELIKRSEAQVEKAQGAEG